MIRGESETLFVGPSGFVHSVETGMRGTRRRGDEVVAMRSVWGMHIRGVVLTGEGKGRRSCVRWYEGSVSDVVAY